ncbi:MAG: reverse transcriptase domain-containing protein [Chloroflexota bacterium]|nr:reverse transcriptase domain-containing protein [Chloroflexota bacterium]
MVNWPWKWRQAPPPPINGAPVNGAPAHAAPAHATVYAPQSATPLGQGGATPFVTATQVLAEPPTPQRVGILKSQAPARLFTPLLLQQAWLAVKRAGGGAGVDGVSLQAFAKRLKPELTRLHAELVAGDYRPQPLRQVVVPKPNGGLRPLAIWVLRDRIAQRAVYALLAPTFESIFLPCSYGFRPGRSVENAVQQVIEHRNAHQRWIVNADIEHCFDELDCHLLLTLVGKRVQDELLLRYVRLWLQADILNSMDGVPRKAGASQGSPLSPLLANIYLHEMDQAMIGQGLAFVRYADNFVICCRRKGDAENAGMAAAAVLTRLHLTLNAGKSHIVHTDQGFAWLGYFFIRNECHRIAGKG